MVVESLTRLARSCGGGRVADGEFTRRLYSISAESLVQHGGWVDPTGAGAKRPPLQCARTQQPACCPVLPANLQQTQTPVEGVHYARARTILPAHVAQWSSPPPPRSAHHWSLPTMFMGLAAARLIKPPATAVKKHSRVRKNSPSCSTLTGAWLALGTWVLQVCAHSSRGGEGGASSSG